MHKLEEGQNKESYRVQQHRSSLTAMVETIIEIQYFGSRCVEEPFVLQ